MSESFDAMMAWCRSCDVGLGLGACLQGVEREGLRVDRSGVLASTPHQHALGSKLTHPYVTTDFAEAQLELVTPPLSSSAKTAEFLKQVHSFVQSEIQDELIWPFSTACILPSPDNMAIAGFGDSEEARTKHLYRQGLSHRYGRRMMALSGIHFNLSFTGRLWDRFHERWGRGLGLQDFVSSRYLHIIRNFNRISWLPTYLFGASPVAHQSSLDRIPEAAESMGDGSYFLPFGTSIRLGGSGYYGRSQNSIHVGYNTLSQYTADLGKVLAAPHPKFSGSVFDPQGNQLQLNGNYLQLEAEHYAVVRPKPDPAVQMRPVESVAQNGVAYVEVRCLDLDPFSPEGIDRTQMDFLQLLLIHCLLKESPPMNEEQYLSAKENLYQTAMQGREPSLQLNRQGDAFPLKAWADEILGELEEIASLLSKERYVQAIQQQRAKLKDSTLTPSFQVLDPMRTGTKGFIDYGLELAQGHQEVLLQQSELPEILKRFKPIVEQSWESHRAMRVL